MYYSDVRAWATRMVDASLSPTELFEVSDDRLRIIIDEFMDELTRSMKEKDKKMLKCLKSFVTSQPTGDEHGEFLLIDLGGTNLRVGQGDLFGNHRYTLEEEPFLVPEDIKAGSGYALFDFIAEKVLAFRQRTGSKANKIGFTFSFPVEQSRIDDGKLIQFNKAYDCHDIVGKDVVKLLQERLPSDLQVCSLVNDTVGTLVAHAYKNPNTKMSVILGTGTNAAYWDILDGEQMIVNIEWGGFGDHSNRKILPLTVYDDKIDEQSENIGMQTFEKMISGMYLGELFRLAAGNSIKDEYNTPYSIHTEDLESLTKY